MPAKWRGLLEELAPVFARRSTHRLFMLLACGLILADRGLQEAQGYAGLGDVKTAEQLLHRASDLVTGAGEPPESLYWYTEPFLWMNIGLTQHAIGQHRDAADSLASGIAGLPADQQNAEWMGGVQAGF
jgi:hypothetical protein